MNSIVWKSGIIAIFFILSHCNNDISSTATIHPILNLELKKINDSLKVVFTTTSAKNYSMYRIVDTMCLFGIIHHEPINGMDSIVVEIDTVFNDSVGKFFGMWDVPDSLVQDTVLLPRTTIFGCVSDETEHKACASLKLF